MQATRIGAPAITVSCCGNYQLPYSDCQSNRFRISSLVPAHRYVVGRRASGISGYESFTAGTVDGSWHCCICSDAGHALRQLSSTSLELKCQCCYSNKALTTRWPDLVTSGSTEAEYVTTKSSSRATTTMGFCNISHTLSHVRLAGTNLIRHTVAKPSYAHQLRLMRSFGLYHINNFFTFRDTTQILLPFSVCI
jgi:hypothetical protein